MEKDCGQCAAEAVCLFVDAGCAWCTGPFKEPADYAEFLHRVKDQLQQKKGGDHKCLNLRYRGN